MPSPEVPRREHAVPPGRAGRGIRAPGRAAPGASHSAPR